MCWIISTGLSHLPVVFTLHKQPQNPETPFHREHTGQSSETNPQVPQASTGRAFGWTMGSCRRYEYRIVITWKVFGNFKEPCVPLGVGHL